MTVRERLDDLGELTEQLAFAIYPSLEATIAQYSSPEANAHHAAKMKSASKKAPTKRAAAKKKAAAKKAPKAAARRDREIR